MPFIDLPERIPGLRAQARESRPWYRITNQAADEAEVMLYDEVGGWFGTTADEFINDLRGITAPNILLRVNSPGGQVYEGIAIANAIRSHPANVTVQVDGIAASIASVIAMAGDQVRMMPNAMIMVHEASGLTVGNAADHRETAELLDKISGNIADAYAARAGGTRDEWRQVMMKETWYTAEEAVAAGLADEALSASVAQAEPDADDAMRARFDLAAYGYTGPAHPEPSKPAEPAAKPESQAEAQPASLTVDIEQLLTPEIVAAIRAHVAAPATPDRTQDTAATHADEGNDDEPPADSAAIEPDPWAALTAHLTAPDDWTALTSHLTTSSATGA